MDAFTHARPLNQQIDDLVSEVELERGAPQSFDGESQYPDEISSDWMRWRMSAELACIRKELDGQRATAGAVVDRSYVENGGSSVNLVPEFKRGRIFLTKWMGFLRAGRLLKDVQRSSR